MGLLDELPDDWREKIDELVDREDIQKIERNLASATNICPGRDDIFKAFRLCPFQDVKVVIIGQNPYTNGEATGLAFAVKDGLGLTASLGRIYDLLLAAGMRPPLGTELEGWARQGVLLLNSILTAEPGTHEQHGSAHKDWGWQNLTKAAVESLKERSASHPVLFLAWGEEAKKMVGTAEWPHEVWTCCHPAARGKKEETFGACDHFKKVTGWLLNAGYDETIDWSLG